MTWDQYWWIVWERRRPNPSARMQWARTSDGTSAGRWVAACGERWTPCHPVRRTEKLRSKIAGPLFFSHILSSASDGGRINRVQAGFISTLSMRILDFCETIYQRDRLTLDVMQQSAQKATGWWGSQEYEMESSRGRVRRRNLKNPEYCTPVIKEAVPLVNRT